MKEIVELNNYSIEFMDSFEYKQHILDIYYGKTEWKDLKDVFTHGKCSDIPESIANKIVDKTGTILGGYINYKDENNMLTIKDSAKESFQSLSNLEYCVIKNKNNE